MSTFDVPTFVDAFERYIAQDEAKNAKHRNGNYTLGLPMEDYLHVAAHLGHTLVEKPKTWIRENLLQVAPQAFVFFGGDVLEEWLEEGQLTIAYRKGTPAMDSRTLGRLCGANSVEEFIDQQLHQASV